MLGPRQVDISRMLFILGAYAIAFPVAMKVFSILWGRHPMPFDPDLVVVGVVLWILSVVCHIARRGRGVTIPPHVRVIGLCVAVALFLLLGILIWSWV